MAYIKTLYKMKGVKQLAILLIAPAMLFACSNNPPDPLCVGSDDLQPSVSKNITVNSTDSSWINSYLDVSQGSALNIQSTGNVDLCESTQVADAGWILLSTSTPSPTNNLWQDSGLAIQSGTRYKIVITGKYSDDSGSTCTADTYFNSDCWTDINSGKAIFAFIGSSPSNATNGAGTVFHNGQNTGTNLFELYDRTNSVSGYDKVLTDNGELYFRYRDSVPGYALDTSFMGGYGDNRGGYTISVYKYGTVGYHSGCLGTKGKFLQAKIVPLGSPCATAASIINIGACYNTTVGSGTGITAADTCINGKYSTINAPTTGRVCVHMEDSVVNGGDGDYTQFVPSLTTPGAGTIRSSCSVTSFTSDTDADKTNCVTTINGITPAHTITAALGTVTGVSSCTVTAASDSSPPAGTTAANAGDMCRVAINARLVINNTCTVTSFNSDTSAHKTACAGFINTVRNAALGITNPDPSIAANHEVTAASGTVTGANTCLITATATTTPSGTSATNPSDAYSCLTYLNSKVAALAAATIPPAITAPDPSCAVTAFTSDSNAVVAPSSISHQTNCVNTINSLTPTHQITSVLGTVSGANSCVVTSATGTNPATCVSSINTAIAIIQASAAVAPPAVTGTGSNSGSYSVSMSATKIADTKFLVLINNIVNPVRTILLGDKTAVPPKAGLTETMYRNLTSNGAFIQGARALMALAVVFFAFAYMAGLSNITHKELLNLILKMSLVIAVIGPDSWTFFSKYLFSFFIDGTDSLINIMSNNINSLVSTSNPELMSAAASNTGVDQGNSIFTFLNRTVSLIFSKEANIKLQALLATFPIGMLLAVIVYIGIFYFLFALVKAILAYLVSIIMTALLIFLAPIFICFLLFNITKPIFDRWIRNLVGFALQPILLFMVLSIFNVFIVLTLYTILNFSACFGCIWNLDLPFSEIIGAALPGIHITNFDKFCAIPGYLPWGVDSSEDIANKLAKTPVGLVYAFVFIILANMMLQFIEWVVGVANLLTGDNLNVVSVTSGANAAVSQATGMGKAVGKMGIDTTRFAVRNTAKGVDTLSGHRLSDGAKTVARNVLPRFLTKGGRDEMGQHLAVDRKFMTRAERKGYDRTLNEFNKLSSEEKQVVRNRNRDERDYGKVSGFAKGSRDSLRRAQMADYASLGKSSGSLFTAGSSKDKKEALKKIQDRFSKDNLKEYGETKSVVARAGLRAGSVDETTRQLTAAAKQEATIRLAPKEARSDEAQRLYAEKGKGGILARVARLPYKYNKGALVKKNEESSAAAKLKQPGQNPVGIVESIRALRVTTVGGIIPVIKRSSVAVVNRREIRAEIAAANGGKNPSLLREIRHLGDNKAIKAGMDGRASVRAAGGGKEITLAERIAARGQYRMMAMNRQKSKIAADAKQVTQLREKGAAEILKKEKRPVTTAERLMAGGLFSGTNNTKVLANRDAAEKKKAEKLAAENQKKAAKKAANVSTAFGKVNVGIKEKMKDRNEGKAADELTRQKPATLAEKFKAIEVKRKFGVIPVVSVSAIKIRDARNDLAQVAHTKMKNEANAAGILKTQPPVNAFEKLMALEVDRVGRFIPAIRVSDAKVLDNRNKRTEAAKESYFANEARYTRDIKTSDGRSFKVGPSGVKEDKKE